MLHSPPRAGKFPCNPPSPCKFQCREGCERLIFYLKVLCPSNVLTIFMLLLLYPTTIVSTTKIGESFRQHSAQQKVRLVRKCDSFETRVPRPLFLLHMQTQSVNDKRCSCVSLSGCPLWSFNPAPLDKFHYRPLLHKTVGKLGSVAQKDRHLTCQSVVLVC